MKEKANSNAVITANSVKQKQYAAERSECNMRLAAYDFSEAPVLADDEIEEIL